jgi:hypothetical protein
MLLPSQLCIREEHYNVYLLLFYCVLLEYERSWHEVLFSIFNRKPLSFSSFESIIDIIERELSSLIDFLFLSWLTSAKG